MRIRTDIGRTWIMRDHPRIGARSPLVSLAVVAALAVGALPAEAAVERFKFTSGANYLIVEFLDDDLAHFEISGSGPGPAATQPIATTPQVAKTDYSGPTAFSQSGTGGTTMETPELRIVVNPADLCFTVTDKLRNVTLTTLCPVSLSTETRVLTVQPGPTQHVYGLGEQFVDPPSANGDWTGRDRRPGDNYGNQMIGFSGGAAGNLQIPVLYAVGPDGTNYALFLDHFYKQRWLFTQSPWRLETWGDQIRGYVMTGPDLPDLRRDYMQLTGHPPVPPKKMFGLWVSEYGYDTWAELDGKLATLRANAFPVDGFVLDLQWFGGITPGSDNSAMGRVTWDLTKFPNPQAKIADLAANQGIGLVTIEESYISRGLPEHQDLANRGFLNRAGCATCAPVYLTGNPWWGKGGMIDWTQDAAGDYWHDLKRQPLVNDGIIGHWIDLGEPEMYDPNDWVAGVLPGKHGHADYHNIYNFKWAESIARGFQRQNVTRRPFIMARSGAAGMQRFGAVNWSGDVGGNMPSLAAHLNAQMHMVMSGVDYFGADIGGFHRGGLSPDGFTRWYAHGLLLDVPGRPHTENLCNCKETSPAGIGSLVSNLFNTRLRYALSPYLYSLAHGAWRDGEPVMPPLVYYYQNDPNVRDMGDQKMIGRDLLVATAAADTITSRDVYLPAGSWVDLHSNETLTSTGQTFPARPLTEGGVFRLPVFARAGAVVPMMHVDDKTMTIAGKRSDGTTRNELIVRVYAASTPSAFILYEDDGETIAYQQGQVRTTQLAQQRTGDVAAVTIAPAAGTFAGAPASRANVVELVAEASKASAVTLNGQPLTQRTSRGDFDGAASGWFNAGGGLMLAKSAPLAVGDAKTFAFTLVPDAAAGGVSARFECRNGTTSFGTAVYVVGNVPQLGNWAAAGGVKLEPNGPYPTWTGTVAKLPADTSVEWKCIKRPETAASPVEWEPGANNVLATPADGAVGTTVGDFAGGGPAPAGVSAQFVCDNGTTTFGTSVYVVGSVGPLGTWDPAKAVKLEPTAYPRWTGSIGNLPAATQIAWKCIKRPEAAASPVTWEPGADNVFTSAGTGSGGPTFGNFQ
jgi:alpha-glucosidase